MRETDTSDSRAVRISRWMWRYSLWTVLCFGVPLLLFLVYTSRH